MSDEERKIVGTTVPQPVSETGPYGRAGGNTGVLLALAGFEVYLKPDGGLAFGEGVVAPELDLRTKDDARDVCLYPHGDGPSVLYWMYRGTGEASVQRAMEREGIRYDITVLAPGKVGSEYVKTVGHIHPVAPGGMWTYPEVYQVLFGKAHFLLQRGGELSGEADDFAVADFEAGDVLVVWPNYGHVTVNPGDSYLVMANFVARNFKSIYDPIRQRKGLAYYNVEYKDQSIFIPNDSYSRHPRPRLIKPRNWQELGLVRGTSMYSLWKSGRARMDFLTDPARYRELWEREGIRPL